MATTYNTYGAKSPAAQGPYGSQGPLAPGGGAPRGDTASPTGSLTGIDPNAAYSQITSRFRTKFGRDMRADEQQALYSQPGVGYTPGATVTQSMLDTALGLIDRYTGDLANPWGPAAGAAGPTSPLSTRVPGWTPYSPGTPPPEATYRPGQLPTTPLPTYNPYQHTQFQAPNQAGTENAQNELLMRVLGSPESLDPLTISRLQERQKEDALRYEQDLGQQLRQSAASRGVGGGGAAQAGLRRLGQDTSRSILGSNRDIAIEAARTNMADRLNALGAATGVLNARSGRGVSEYGATLAGQQAQAGQNLLGQESQVNAINHMLQVALGQEGLNQAGASSALSAWGTGVDANQAASIANLQRYLGELGIELDQSKLVEASNQFKQQYGLDLMQILNQMVMGRAEYGIGLAQLGQGAQGALQNWITGQNRR